MEHVWEEGADCVCAYGWCLCIHPPLVFGPACWSAWLCNLACVFRPFQLTVDSQQLPGGARVCCSVMKAFLISGLGCSVLASPLETAEINTCCPLACSRPVTDLARGSRSGPLLAAADTRTFKICVVLPFNIVIPSR